MKKSRWLVAIAVNAALICMGLLLAELVLQLGARWFPDIAFVTMSRERIKEVYGEKKVRDKRLGKRGNPRFPGNDSRGFRNPRALDRADVVALGDSHTWGSSVKRDEAWPSVLSEISDRSVYNMGLGSWGVTHNYENLPLALELQPELVVFGLYFGNDFYNDFQFARMHDLTAEFVSNDVIKEVQRMEEKKRLRDEMHVLFKAASTVVKSKDTKKSKKTRKVNKKRKRSFVARVKKFLEKNSSLYGLWRTTEKWLSSKDDGIALLSGNFEKAVASLREDQLPYVSVFDGGDWKTILTGPYRFRGMDDSDLRIRTGFEISLGTIRRMHARVTEAGFDFVLLLIPTKEYIFWPKVSDPDQHRDLEALVRTEERLHLEVMERMEAQGIDTIDPSASLRTSREQPYRPDANGHPNSVGHVIIANEVLRYIERTYGSRENH